MKTIFKSMSCLILGAMIVTPMFAQQKDLYPELEGPGPVVIISKDKNGKVYDASWTVEKKLQLCRSHFVLDELKKRGFTELESALSSCYEKIQQVREWSNAIKHRGGIDYKYLKPQKPFKMYYCGGSTLTSSSFDLQKTGTLDQFEIKDFEPNEKVDIDEMIPNLVNAYISLRICLEKIIGAIFSNERQGDIME